MQSLSFDEVLVRMTQHDSRYSRDAYLFLREALDHTQTKLIRSEKSKAQHVTGRELLDGLRDYALGQFGPMAKTVLNEWGIRNCEDFGEIVFNMVEHGLLSKTETDSRDDFKGGYPFDEAFCRPFRPKGSQTVLSPPATTQVDPI